MLVDLVELTRRSEILADALVLEVGTPSQFVKSFQFAHNATSTSAKVGRSTNVTSTAFGLYMLLGPHRAVEIPSGAVVNREPLLSEVPVDGMVEFCWSQLSRQYVRGSNGLAKTIGAGKGGRPRDSGSDVGPLPNTYNTSLQFAGALVGARVASIRLSNDQLRVGCAVARLVASWLTNSHVTSIFPPTPGQDANAPLSHLTTKHYLTFWNFVSLLEWMKLASGYEKTEEIVRSMDESAIAVKNARDWATSHLAYIISCHHSGVRGQFDASDFLFSLCISSLRSDSEHGEGSKEIVKEGLGIFLGSHLTPDGSIASRSPVFVNHHGDDIVISTAEHAALLLEALSPYCDEYFGQVCNLADYILSRRVGLLSWGLDDGRNRPSKNVFYTLSSLSALRRYQFLLQSQIDTEVVKQIGVVREKLSPEISKMRLPQSVEDLIKFEIVYPIQHGQRDLATMSLLLSGPPGTSKTTIAKRIALDLDWEYLEIDQGVFLRKGIAEVEAEAERIFSLIRLLTNRVILFDEFEEMISSREGQGKNDKQSRFLTTSMLPRLHKIRDDAKIMFVIATNHEEAADRAAVRFGRIDRKVEVGFPTGEARHAMFESIAERLMLGNKSRQLLNEMRFPEAVGFHEGDTNLEFEALTHGHIKDVVRLLRLKELRDGSQSVNKALVVSVVKRSIEHSRTTDGLQMGDTL